MMPFCLKPEITVSPVQLVCYTADFRVVTQQWGGALRDDTKNGCVADYRSAKMRRNTVTYWRAVFANSETCSHIRLNDASRKTLLQASRKKPRKLTDHGKTTSTTRADFKFNTVKPVLSKHHRGML